MKVPMHPQFSQLMKDATAHTRAGDLQAAMAAITAALERSAAPAPVPRTDDGVIDVEARAIERDVPAAAAAAAAPQAQTAAQSSPAISPTGPARATTGCSSRQHRRRGRKR